MQSSSLRNVLLAHVGIGLAIGLALPFLVNPFVLWQPGTHTGFSLAAAVGGAIIGLLNYWIVHRLMAEPLQSIADVATAIGNGDLTRRCDIEGGDSLGAIAQAINQMATTLRKLIDDLGTLGSDVSSDSRSLQHTFGDVRERFPSADQLAAEAGAVPVTYQSGKTRSVAFRWACNHRLRQAITCLADNSRHANAWAKSLYQAARARGCDHTHAIRILARAWLRVIWRAWTDRKPYHPSLHGNAVALASRHGG